MTRVGVQEAASRIRRGELVAYPTETVWGLAADVRSEAAVARLRAWKGRDAEKPLSVLVESFATLETLGAETTPLAARLAAKFWPGPLTLVVRCARAFAPGVADADGSVGFRCSPHPAARALARAAGPVTATSLNRSGAPACATRAEAETVAGGDVALLEGEDAHGAAPSSVVDASGARLRVLRAGAIDARALEAAARGESVG
jgi:tRNA threonylcarbamoyl adenosine modification protein (Sua5/YciO/YrdC/YwlC family)